MAAAVEVSSRPDRAPAVSDSDNDDRPDKEPEFVIHIVDDQPPAPAPAPTPLWPPPVLRRPAVPPALPAAPQVDDLDGPQVVHCGRTGLIIKLLISVVVMVLPVVTVALVAGVHEEFAGRLLVYACQFFICWVAFGWIFFDDGLYMECGPIDI